MRIEYFLFSSIDFECIDFHDFKNILEGQRAEGLNMPER